MLQKISTRHSSSSIGSASTRRLDSIADMPQRRTRRLLGESNEVNARSRKLKALDHNAALRRYDKAWKVKGKCKFPSDILLPSYSATKLLLSKDKIDDLDESIISIPKKSLLSECRLERPSNHKSANFDILSNQEWSPVPQPQPAPLRYYKA